MKKVSLLLTVCMLIFIFTHANAPQINVLKEKIKESKTIRKEINVTFHDRDHYTKPQQNSMALKKKIDAEAVKKNENTKFSLSNQFFSGLQGYKKAKNMKELVEKHRLDSVVFKDQNGEDINKSLFYFDERQWPQKLLNMVYGYFSDGWDLYEEYNYEWNEDGYLLSESVVLPVYDDGMKYEYTYNEQKLCDSWTVSYLIEGNWTYILKTTYKYDADENPIELVTFFYDNSLWIYDTKEIAGYDELNRQNHFETYGWNGNDWVGNYKDEMTWLRKPTGEDLLIRNFNSDWIPAINDWQYFSDFEQTFDANFRLTYQAFSYWNPITGDWSGEVEDDWGWVYYNKKTVLEYDSEGKQNYELYSELKNALWVPAFEYEFDWHNYTPTNETELNRKGYNYGDDGSVRDWVSDLWQRYSLAFPLIIAIDNWHFTYRKESSNWWGGWEDIYEEMYVFDEVGRRTEEKYWQFWDNIKLADIWAIFAFDNNDNAIQLQFYMGQYTGDDDWYLASTNKWEFDQYNFPIRSYRYVGEDQPDFGNGVDFDYEIPASKCILFEYVNDFKIDFLYEYEGNGTDFEVSTRTFYYSVHEVEKIESFDTDKSVIIYPNPTTGLLTIDNGKFTIDSVEVFDISGKKISSQHLIPTSSHHLINLSQLASGIYIIDVNGVKLKVVKQ